MLFWEERKCGRYKCFLSNDWLWVFLRHCCDFNFLSMFHLPCSFFLLAKIIYYMSEKIRDVGFHWIVWNTTGKIYKKMKQHYINSYVVPNIWCAWCSVFLFGLNGNGSKWLSIHSIVTIRMKIRHQWSGLFWKYGSKLSWMTQTGNL